MKVIAVVMAGGLGVRLWPRSTERQPKQFVHTLGEGTLIQNTVMRLLPFIDLQDIHVVTTADLAHLVSDQLPMIPAGNVLREPFGRNTAPCIAYSATLMQRKYPDGAVMVVLPSDHLISNVREFQGMLDRAVSAAEATGRIVTIGVMPTRPETGFGYIQVGDEIPTENPVLNSVLKSVNVFAEKPDAATAQRFLDAGDFVWNSGIVVGTLASIIRAVDMHLPDHGPLFHLLERYIGTPDEGDMIENFYRQMRSVSFDVGVLEKDSTIGVVEGSFGWSDVGTWDELYRMSMKDGKNNVIEGNVVTLQTSNCLVSGTTGRLIGIVDVDNLIVVETESSIMICRRGATERVRDLVDVLRRRHIAQHL
ncbi:MAG: sugar phosphate nucleotidyltransferase [Candidatus Kapabacteria bacterium]|nr:sugar phosphate nucleotidyltransferase [Candidatus Kapabacteria bacterium]